MILYCLRYQRWTFRCMVHDFMVDVEPGHSVINGPDEIGVGVVRVRW